MPAFRRVDASQARPGALGILVPPGEPTLVIVRPRPLPWDLLPARWNGARDSPPAFCQFAREEAAAVARGFQHALEQAALHDRSPLETFGDGNRFQVWARLDELFWIVCRRSPGQAYQPTIFPTQEEAQTAAEQLMPFLWPGTDAEQEFYFNTQKFATSPP